MPFLIGKTDESMDHVMQDSWMNENSFYHVKELGDLLLTQRICVKSISICHVSYMFVMPGYYE